MQNIVLTLMYDGSPYHGWQIQNNAVSVCQVVTDAVKRVTGEDVEITGCSRTDAGVHALEYVCNFASNTSIPPDRLRYALNTKLPDTIRVIQSGAADSDFHARFSAKSKTYLYKAYTSEIENPFYRNYAYHFPYKLRLDAMQAAAGHFIGTHDFTAFMTTGSSQKTTVRTVHDLKAEMEGDMVQFTINANAYLYNMVRIISGTLLYVGCGRIAPEEIPAILESRDRRRGGITAGPQGLYLQKIYY